MALNANPGHSLTLQTVGTFRPHHEIRAKRPASLTPDISNGVRRNTGDAAHRQASILGTYGLCHYRRFADRHDDRIDRPSCSNEPGEAGRAEMARQKKYQNTSGAALPLTQHPDRSREEMDAIAI